MNTSPRLIYSTIFALSALAPLSVTPSLVTSGSAVSVSAVYATPTQDKPGSLPGLSAEVREGEVDVKSVDVKGSSMPRIIAYGVINAPPQAVWSVVVDCGRYSKTMDNVKSSKRVSGSLTGGQMRCELVADLPWPLSDLRSVVDVSFGKLKGGGFKRTWKLVEGDYKRNEGSWTLTPLDGGAHTLLRYELHVEPKTSVPEWLKRKAAKAKVPGMFKRLRAEVAKR